MNNQDTDTKQKILKAAESEFLEKGFKSSSLRNIVKKANVTTGAFYGYFPTKEALFASLVEQHAAIVMERFVQSQRKFEELPSEMQPQNMASGSHEFLQWLVEYIYNFYISFKLLICCADGTEYENFVERMVEIEVEQTLKFVDVLRELGHQVPIIDKQFCHLLSSGMFNAIFEILVHDMPKEQSKCYVNRLCEFHTAGWKKIMGL